MRGQIYNLSYAMALGLFSITLLAADAVPDPAGSLSGESTPSALQSSDQCDFIRLAIDSLPESGGSIKIPAGVFECRSKIVIKKNHVRLRGAGVESTTLKLADYSESPLLVIGDDQVTQSSTGEWVTATRVSDIRVSNMTLDGNWHNEDVSHECGKASCDGDVQAIRNNGITIRGASNIKISHVVAHSAISGGLVTEKYCDHLQIDDFTSYDNYFDGLAGYQTEMSTFTKLNLSRNRGAGISIDIDFNNNIFSDGILSGNGDVGIFARQIHNVVFEKLQISDSGNHGAFLADSGVPNSCARDNEFKSVTIEGSKGYGIYLTGPCTGNKVSGDSVFDKNSSGCYFVDTSAAMSVEPNTQCIN